MKILIVEDEPPIAEYTENCLWQILGSKIQDIHICLTLAEAFKFLKNHTIDLCFLDLNLSGEDGYDILKKTVSMSFHTIIISAHVERAAKAFEYGVIDFIPKPFNIKRLRQAFDRYFGHIKIPFHMKYLVIQKSGNHILLPVKDAVYFKADRYLVEIHMENGSSEYAEKPLNQLERILPDNFVRIHRSYIVNLHSVESFKHVGSGVYRVRLHQGTELRMSRNRSRNFINLLNAK